MGEITSGNLIIPQINWAIAEVHPLWKMREEMIELITSAVWLECTPGQTISMPIRVASVLRTIMQLKKLDSDVSHMGFSAFKNEDLLCYLRNHYRDGYANIYIHAGEIDCEIVRIDFFKNF